MAVLGRRTRRISIVMIAATVLGGAACIDLFHSTDFTTLCPGDAAACTPEAGSAEASTEPDASPPDATPPIDFCTYSPVEARKHAERACAWMGACMGVLEGSTFANCMLRARAAYDCSVNPSLRPQGSTAVLWSCLADVASCDAVTTCLFGGPGPTCTSDSQGAFTACSKSTSVVECGLIGQAIPPLAVQSCVLEGRSCATVDTGKALCAGKAQVSCDGGARCEGTSGIICQNAGGIAADIGFDCAAFGGQRCVSDDAGLACAPGDTASACTGSSDITCDDAGTASRCVGGKRVEMHCGAFGQGCAPTPSALDLLTACENLDAPTRCTAADDCNGGIVRSCAQGKAFSANCSDLGLGPCQKQASPRGPFATCTKP